MGWNLLEKEQPAELETVWACNPETGSVALACRVWIEDGELSGWLWAVSNGTVYQKEGRIIAECDMDDDYDFTHWMPLPVLPNVA